MGTVSIDKVIALLTLISIVVGSFGMIYRYFSATPLEKFLMEGTDKVWVAVTEFLGYFFAVILMQLILVILWNKGLIMLRSKLPLVQDFRVPMLLALIMAPNEELSPNKFIKRYSWLEICKDCLILAFAIVIYFKMFEYLGVFKNKGGLYTVGVGTFIWMIIEVILKREQFVVVVGYVFPFIFGIKSVKSLIERFVSKKYRGCSDNIIVIGTALTNAVMAMKFAICLFITILVELVSNRMRLSLFNVQLLGLLLTLQAIDMYVRRRGWIYDEFWRICSVSLLLAATTPLALLSIYYYFNRSLEIILISFVGVGLLWTMILNAWIPEKLPEFNKRAVFRVLLKDDDIQYYCYGIKEGYILCGTEASQKGQKEFRLIPIDEIKSICQGEVMNLDEKDESQNTSWICAHNSGCNGVCPDVLFIDKIDGKVVGEGIKGKDGILWYQVEEGKHFVHMTASWKQKNKCNNKNRSMISVGEIEVDLSAGSRYEIKYNINEMLFEINKI